MQDNVLIELLQKNPHKGIERIMREYTGFVYAIAKTKLIGICTLEDIEEIVSDVFFQLYEQRESLDISKGSLKAWLAVTVTRRAIDIYRKKAPENSISLREDIPEKEDQFEKSTERTAIVTAIKSLGEPNSEILLRKLYFGQTAREIANIKGMTTSAVEKRISRSYVILRELLGGEI